MLAAPRWASSSPLDELDEELLGEDELLEELEEDDDPTWSCARLSAVRR